MLGGGAGAIWEMIARIKANEELRKKKKPKQGEFSYGRSEPKTKEHRKYSEQEIQESKNKIAKLNEKEKRNTVIAILISILVLIVLYYFFTEYWDNLSKRE